MLHRTMSLFLLVVLSACGGRPGSQAHRVGSQQEGLLADTAGMVNALRGFVFVKAPVSDASVLVYAAEQLDGQKKLVARTVTAKNGHFAVDLGAFEGGAWVEVHWPGSQIRLSAPIARVALGIDNDEVAITPVTTLATSYAGYLVHQGAVWEDATRQSTERMEAHFFAVPHHFLEPRPWPSNLTGPKKACELDAATQASAVTQALYTRAAKLSFVHGTTRDEHDAFALLLQALCRDISADGMFDGLGDGGAAILLGDSSLSSEALRTELVADLRDFLAGPTNATQCNEDDVADMLSHLQRSSAPLFMAAIQAKQAAPIEATAPPQLRGCTVLDGQGYLQDPLLPVRGVVTLTCTWSGETALERTWAGYFVGNEFLQVQRPVQDPDVWQATLDTQRLQQRYPEIDGCELSLFAKDHTGGVANEKLALAWKNAPPTLEIQAVKVGEQELGDAGQMAWRSKDAGVTIAGVVSDDALVAQLWVNGALHAESHLNDGEMPGLDGRRPFRLQSGALGCDHADGVEVRVTDIVGNVSSHALTVACASDAPIIVPALTRYFADWGPTETAAISKGWDGDAVDIYKLYDKFEYVPERGLTVEAGNLPVIHFSVAQADPGKVMDAPRVYYRALFSGPAEHERGWQELAPSVANSYELPLSYQTLLPHNVLEMPLELTRTYNYVSRTNPADRHAVEIKAVNSAGLETVRRFDFHLYMRAPALHLSLFRTSPRLQQTPYSRLFAAHEFYGPSFEGSVHWPVACDELSTFRCGAVSVFAAVKATMHVLQLQDEQQHDRNRRLIPHNKSCFLNPHQGWLPERGCYKLDHQDWGTHRKAIHHAYDGFQLGDLHSGEVRQEVGPNLTAKMEFIVSGDLKPSNWIWDAEVPGRPAAWRWHNKEIGLEWHNGDIGAIHSRLLATVVATRASLLPNVRVATPLGVAPLLSPIIEWGPAERVWSWLE